MTTFKNNAKYAELMMTYLDVAIMENNPLTVQEVLSTFKWRFKGGSLKEASDKTRLRPIVSDIVFPDGTTEEILTQWPDGVQARALHLLLRNRRQQWKPKMVAIVSKIATYQVLTSSLVSGVPCVALYSGMKSIYHIFSLIWKWSDSHKNDPEWSLLQEYTREMLAGTGAVSRVFLPAVEENRKSYEKILTASRVQGLLRAVWGVKSLIRTMGSKPARDTARAMGYEGAEQWEMAREDELGTTVRVSDLKVQMRFQTVKVGDLQFAVTQGAAVLGQGEVRYALGKSDVERLHQLLMSTASCIVGVCAQATVGTPLQRSKAMLAVEVTERNLTRIVRSSQKVKLGDEVLVCKGYRRAYTAVLGRLAGPLCKEETEGLVEEALMTADIGVLDVSGFLQDATRLDAASALNASKVFKVCPAPDVSPGGAMIDRVIQIGDGNEVDHTIMDSFKEELTSQILRAYIRSPGVKLNLRPGLGAPSWLGNYRATEFDMVPSMEIDKFLAWEGTANMPDISPFDPSAWKDSGIGVDTIKQTTKWDTPKHMRNMITRLLFDPECPMPGDKDFTNDNVIKFFVKAEGHKDPARGIFSANLSDRQLQSWMEKAVDQVATYHPSFMIGQDMEVKTTKVIQLTARPARSDCLALFYSFDISGWSAKMPGEVQRISHDIWARLYDSHTFRNATRMNEGSHIYLDMEGYRGWFKNTHANLEGFNGKEMTMVLVALLSLAVRRWRARVVEQDVMSKTEAEACSALLFAYIDDGLSRIDLPRAVAMEAFDVYKKVVIETFSMCGFSVEVTKCFPSDRFAIFLNEVYIAGRHVVHGVRAAMAVSSEPTERHTTLIERVSSVATGCRGATMAGLSPQSAVMLMAYHTHMHLLEWVTERDPVVLAAWSMTPRSWGGLGMPNMMQIYTSGSAAAFEEGSATIQAYARINVSVKRAFMSLLTAGLADRTPMEVLTAPLSGKVSSGMMVDSRVAVLVRRALQKKMEMGKLSPYAERLLRYADTEAFSLYAESIVPLGEKEVVQEQMLINMAEAHPHCVFSDFAVRVEKSMTVLQIVGGSMFSQMIQNNRTEAEVSVHVYKMRMI